MENLQNNTHRRVNILTGESVLVSPHRAKRPWQGKEEKTINKENKTYDASCYLCAGNTRINGEVNPQYNAAFVFTNDFGALQKENPSFNYENGLLKATSETGICKVICFSPNHSHSLADLEPQQIQKIITTWKKEFLFLGKQPDINYVQIFENKGEVMGCSNPHPHGQIWSQSSIPNEVLKKDIQQKKFYLKNKTSLLASYLQEEIQNKERILFKNKHFIALVPFWATWPYEIMIAPRKHQQNIAQLTNKEEESFAEIISKVTRAYDALFNCSFPYSSGIHQSPTNKENQNHWHWHMSFYPPLLRSAKVKKFMVGYEMFGEPQRDITAETAANTLRKHV